jgi:hypothetical protein
MKPKYKEEIRYKKAFKSKNQVTLQIFEIFDDDSSFLKFFGMRKAGEEKARRKVQCSIILSSYTIATIQYKVNKWSGYGHLLDVANP